MIHNVLLIDKVDGIEIRELSTTDLYVHHAA